MSVRTPRLSDWQIQETTNQHYQSSPEALVQDTLRIQEGSLSDTGALVIKTGEFTGRSPKDKFLVRDAKTDQTVNWNEFNQPIAPESFERIRTDVKHYLSTLKEVWVRDCFVCADPRY